MIIMESFRDWLLESFRDNLPMKIRFLRWEQIYTEIEDMDMIKEWLDENLPKNSWHVNILLDPSSPRPFSHCQISFKTIEDAMAFKLRWL